MQHWRLPPAARTPRFPTASIKIGVMNDQSGTYADLAGPGSVVAARMAVEDFGAAKKGMKVEIVVADHQNKPEVGSSIARQWFDVDKVDLIVDVPTSSVVLAVNQVAREKNKVLIVSTGATVDLTGQGVHAELGSLDLRYVVARQRHRHRGSERRRQHVVLPHRRLRVRAFSRSADRGGRAEARRQGGRARCAIRSPRPTCRRSCSRRRSSKAKIIGLANAGADTINAIKQGAEFGIVKGRPAIRGLARVPDRRALARAPRRAGPAPHRVVLLGLESDQTRGVVAALREAAQGRACRPWARRASMRACCTT